MLGVHDGSVVWSGVRMRGYPPRCVASKPVRLDEFCDACQGRLETVLDCFRSCQSDEWWEDNEHSTRVQVELSPRDQQRAEFSIFAPFFFRDFFEVPFDYSPPHSFCQFVVPGGRDETCQ